MTLARKALAAAILAVILFAAVVVQLTVVNRLPFPAGAVPDLVLLLVTAIAVATTPALAAVTGFAGGLALDVAPPAAHYAGEYALVFCLAAYAAARVSRAISDRAGERDPVTAFTVVAVAAAAGETGRAALGLLLSDPDVTPAAVSRVLPGAILYDLLLAPFAFWLVALVTRHAAARSRDSERAPALTFGPGKRPASVLRHASAGAAPELHLAGTGAAYGTRSPARRVPRLRLDGTGRNYAPKPAAGRGPKLRLSGGSSPSVPGTAAAFSGRSPSPLAAGRTRKLSFGGDLPVRALARPARTPGKNWLRPGTGGTSGSGVSGSAAAGSPAGRKARHPRRFTRGGLGTARSGASAVTSQFPKTSAEALAARSAPSGLSALSGAGTPLAGRRAPQAGWLSGSRSASAPVARKTPRAGWLGGARGRPPGVIGSAVRGHTMTGRGAGVRGAAFRRRRTFGGDWPAASPSGAWLRRSRNPWGKRSQRLLRMMGVSK